MSVLVNDILKLIYLGIPKCASEYMEKNLKNNYNFVTMTNETIQCYLNKSQELKIQLYNKNIVDNYYEIFNIDQKYDTYTFFSIIRNPYERFLSGFLYCHGKPLIKNDVKNLIYIENCCRNVYSSGLAESKNINFDNLEDIIKNKKNIYETNMWAYGHLFIVQNSLLSSVKQKKTLLKLENLQYELKHFLETNNVNIIETDQTKSNDTLRNHYIYDYYTDYSIEFVNNYFNDDFDNFGYKKFKNVEEMKAFYGEE